MAEPVFFASPDEWRDWLIAHHASATECHVGFVKVKGGKAPLTNSDAVDQALCFGWIDGVVRRIDDERYVKRFTPRKPGSIWSRVNVAKVERLRELGLMTDAGESAYAMRRDDRTGIYAFEKPTQLLEAAERARFTANRAAWRYFERQPPWYRRNAIHWVTSAKRAETRARRLATLMADSTDGRWIRHLDRNASRVADDSN